MVILADAVVPERVMEQDDGPMTDAMDDDEEEIVAPQLDANRGIAIDGRQACEPVGSTDAEHHPQQMPEIDQVDGVGEIVRTTDEHYDELSDAGDEDLQGELFGGNDDGNMDHRAVKDDDAGESGGFNDDSEMSDGGDEGCGGNSSGGNEIGDLDIPESVDAGVSSGHPSRPRAQRMAPLSL